MTKKVLIVVTSARDGLPEPTGEKLVFLELLTCQRKRTDRAKYVSYSLGNR